MNKYRDIISDRGDVSVIPITIGVVVIGKWEISGNHWGNIWKNMKLGKES